MASDLALDADLTGSISVRDLSDLSYLQIRILGGGAGLDRSVTWAHVCDAYDPWNWLEPGDLVLTSGLIVPAQPEAQASFVEKLESAGLSGLVVSEDERCPPLSDRMLKTADRLAFPILIGAFGVAFAQYGRVVAAANERGENRSLSQVTRVHSEVMAGLIDQGDASSMLDRLGRVVRCALYVVDPVSWEPLVAGHEPPDRVWQAAYEAELGKRSGKAPFVMHLIVDGRAALTMPIPTERSACVIAFPEDDPPPRLTVLQQVAAACALEIGRVDASVERERRSGTGLLNDALNGRLETSAFDALLQARDLEGGLSAFAFEADTEVVDLIARRWVIREFPFLLGVIGQVNVGVIRTGDLGELTDGRRIERWRAGISDSFSGSVGITDAIRQARWALETVGPDGAGFSMYGDGSPSFLPRTLAECEALVDRILGPLITWDREHDGNLVGTLQAYLECDRSPSRASKMLFVHTQTVNYRLTRIQELTGRSMHSTGDVSEFWFALRARSLDQASG